MTYSPSSPRTGKRLLWVTGVLALLLLVGWVGRGWWRSIWWGAMECSAACEPDPGSPVLRLGSGAVLPVLSNVMEDGRRAVDYLTQGDIRDRPRLCRELREAVDALDAAGQLAEAHTLLLSPTDPQARLEGVTWSGPVFACCVSLGIVFHESHGTWHSSNSDCD